MRWALKVSAEKRNSSVGSGVIVREDGYLDPTFVRRRWSAFLAGVDDWRTSLWPILMFGGYLLHSIYSDTASPLNRTAPL